MVKEYVMGNSAIAIGALCSGVKLVAGYPGTPSSEIIETVFHKKHQGVHLEWSVNEKVALEVAASASLSGARSMVTMKQVGLNVAADPLMSLAYVGVKGGMVIVVADDPGPISSQTEQDTRRFASFCRIPVLDPASVEQAFQMIQDAFKLSEKYHTPVILRPTTRVCHGYAPVTYEDNYQVKEYEGFKKDSSRWVIFPALSRKNHALMEERNQEYGENLSSYQFNSIINPRPANRKGVLATGISYAYSREYLADNHEDVCLIQVGTPFPLPEKFLLEAVSQLEEVICLEELSPYMEEELQRLAGRHHLKLTVRGKFTGEVPHAGELSAGLVSDILDKFLGFESLPGPCYRQVPDLPVRPPVLCAGCPHRGAFYAVKTAMRRRKAYFCGDIGCYTLGNALPLDMVDTCLCMGAGITMAQGFSFVDPEAVSFAFIGDSTFFASGITGVINAVYNQANVIFCILDNSTTAMTGHQPHPGTGFNLAGNVVDRIKIEPILRGCGVEQIAVVDPLNLKECTAVIRQYADLPGVRAIIFKSPCISIVKHTAKCCSTENCTGCRMCIKHLGCPALTFQNGKMVIDETICTGCGLCTQVCHYDAVKVVNHA